MFEETLQSKEGQKQWFLSLLVWPEVWQQGEMAQDWHIGKFFPLTLNWHCSHLNLMAFFSLNASCMAVAKKSLLEKSSFIDLRENLIWQICHQHFRLPQLSEEPERPFTDYFYQPGVDTSRLFPVLSFSLIPPVSALVTQTQRRPRSCSP